MTFTKEQLIERCKSQVDYAQAIIDLYPDDVGAAESRRIAEIALAALEAEPVIIVGDDGGDALAYRRLIQAFEPGSRLYTAPQPLADAERAELENYRNAQQEVPEEMDLLTCHLDGVTETYAEGWNACRAALHQGTCGK